jgi:AraC-like DNA-binding protein
LEQLRERPSIQWQRSEDGGLSVVMPVTWQQRCVAACRLVCPDTLPREAFEQHVELLGIVVENFVAKYGELLAAQAGARSSAESPAPAGVSGRALHPQVRAAIDYIAKHAGEPDMTVARVARDLDVNPTYLAHLFSKQVGLRMGRAISEQRIAIAKRLLLETDWQVKRIAFESGHRNSDWFSEVFRAHTGMTPSEFRRKSEKV